MESWLQTASQPAVLKRSGKVALLVGTALVLINQGSLIFSGEATSGTLVRCVLTYFVPFSVSTHATVSALRNSKTQAQES